MKYPWIIPSIKEVRSREDCWPVKPPWPSAQLIDIAVIAAKHLRDPEEILRIVDDVRQNLDDLPRRIERLADARNAVDRSATARKPNVHFAIVRTDKGNMRVSYVPEFPWEFGQVATQYDYHSGGYPVNSLLFFKGFDDLWNSQEMMSSRRQEDLVFALKRNIVAAVVGVVRDAEARVARHCNIISRWQFVEDPSGNFQLLSPEEVNERDKAEAATKEAEIRYRAEAPIRQLKERLEGWNRQYGMDPRRIVGLVEAFHPCRVPFAGRAEIMVQHFGMKSPPSTLQPGTVRSIKNTLAALGETMPEAAIPLAEARTLAQRYLGRIRERPQT